MHTTDIKQPLDPWSGGGLSGPTVTISDVLSDNPPEEFLAYPPEDQDALRFFAQWTVNFLARSDSSLGRTGPVCPFVPPALVKDSIYLTVAAPMLASQSDLSSAMERLRVEFRDIPPRGSGQPAAGDVIYKAVVMLLNRLPSDTAPSIIEAVQKTLKPSYVRDGYMIGEFYPTCQTPGLHSALFRPLAAPVPCLAVRHITIYDAPFMLERDEYIRGFVQCFSNEGRRRLAAILDKNSSNLTARRIATIREMLTA